MAVSKTYPAATIAEENKKLPSGSQLQSLLWEIALTFFLMLGSGLALYLPSLSNIVARPTAKAWHLWSAAVLGIGIVALIAFGNRRALGRTQSPAR